MPTHSRVKLRWIDQGEILIFNRYSNFVEDHDEENPVFYNYESDINLIGLRTQAKRSIKEIMSTTTASIRSKPSIFQWISTHWFEAFLIVYGLWVFVPFLAPVFMQLGWTGAGKSVYFIYSFFCHQLPERSLFWFGEKIMYSLNEIQSVWKNTDNPMILRQFIGNETLGWKVAWSDRMISFYTSVWLFAVIWYPFRNRIKPLSWWSFALLLLPLVLDGGTHAISDFAGIGSGFRDTNTWLIVLTNHAFPATFYAGDALGSFNSIMRFITGILAGLGIVWLAFPYIHQTQAYNQ